jgi:anti-anti-sigma factor
MASLLQIKQSQQEARVPVTVFELVGELDASNYDQFLKKALGAVEAGVHCVLLDLSQLKYISSPGLRAIYTLEVALSEKGEKPTGDSNLNPGSFKSPYLKLFNPSPNVRSALDMLGLTASLEIYGDIQEALDSF